MSKGVTSYTGTDVRERWMGGVGSVVAVEGIDVVTYVSPIGCREEWDGRRWIEGKGHESGRRSLCEQH